MSNSIQLRFFQDGCGYPHSTFYVPALPIVFTLFVLLQNTLLAQAPAGGIRGVVNDVSGAVVTKASLRVSQPQFGGGRVAGTDASGRYYITNLEPGDYEIEAFAPGFDKVKLVRLLVGDQLTVNFQLHPGSVHERVLVSGQTSCPFGKPVWVSLARRRLRPEAITLAPFFQPEDRAARFFLPCSARLIASMENFSGS